METWFQETLDPNTTIDMSNSGYTNDNIGVSFLQHFIECTESSTTSSKYRQLMGTNNGARKLAEWIIRSGRIGQLSPARHLLYS
jgi:hypothetical protein